MAITTSNVDTSTDSFQNWIDKTNTLLEAYSTSIVTTAANSVGGMTTGNATVNGIFTANSLTVEGNSSFGLRGGNTTTNSTLYITSNVSIGNSTVNTVFDTTTITTDLGLTVLGATTLQSTLAVTGSANIGGNTILSGTLHTISGNVNVDSGVLFVDGTNNRIGVNKTTPNSALDVVGNVAITSTLIVQGLITGNAGATVNGQVNIVGQANASSGFKSGSISGTDTGFSANSSTAAVGNTTANVVISSAGIVSSGSNGVLPVSNSVGSALGSTTQRWKLIANTASFSGNVTFDSALVANGSPGSNTQVLTSNGIGLYWADSGVLLSDETTNATRYVTFSSTTSGQATTLGLNSADFTYNPSTGVVSATEFTATSDERYKKDIETIVGALDKVSQLRGVSYKLRESGLGNIGLIAQEVESVVPDVVRTNEEGVKSVTYGNIVGLLIEAIKELKQEIEELKNGNQS